MRYMNSKIAAAVAVAMGGHQAAMAAPPTPAQCATGNSSPFFVPPSTLYVAGSSAAQPTFATALANDLFDSNGETTLSATSGNFKAYCGFAKAGNGAGITAGTVVTIYYRGAGDAAMGVLPIVSGKPIKFLDLSPAACQVAAPVTTGNSVTVGSTDRWGGCVTTHAVEMGITDLEPGVFTTPNYPSVFSTGVFGSATPSQVASLSSTLLFAQVFGVYINTSGLTLSSDGVNLSRETVSNILAGNYADWSAVPSASGLQFSSTSKAITIVNGVPGTSTRTGASIYFLNTGCRNPDFTMFDPNPANDGFSTDDMLTTAAATPGAITYASINYVKRGLTLAQLNGVTPSNAAAAAGQYDWWFEATAQRAATISSNNGTALFNWLTGGELQNIATAPHAADILAIPNIGTNVAAVPLTSSTIGTAATIYINPFTKGQLSCTLPSEQN